jgi:hypothetical protein
LVRRKGENDWKLGSRSIIFKEISLEERYAVEEH